MKTGTIKLTKARIDRLPAATASTGDKYYDRELRGFGIRVYPSGAKKFFVEYGATRKRMALGAYGPLTPDRARELALAALAKVNEGDDPLEERRAEAQANANTFGVWVDEYLAKVTLRKKHPREDRRYLGIALERWKHKPLDAITATDIEKLLNALAESRGKTVATRWLASVRACLQAAWRLDLITSNPAMRVRPFPEPAPRERVLSDAEFARIKDAVDALRESMQPRLNGAGEQRRFDDHTHAAFQILLYTGARKSEVLRAKWADVDLDSGHWRIPTSKSGREQLIKLPQHVRETLRKLDRLGPYLVPGRDPNQPRSDLKRPWEWIIAHAGVKDVKLHDLRRALGRDIALQHGLQMAARALRHSDIRVTQRHYAHLTDDEVGDALEQRTSAKVVPIRSKRSKAAKK